MRRTRPHVVGGLKHPTAPADHQIGLGLYSDPGYLSRFSSALAANGGGEVTWVRQFPQPATTCTGTQVAAAVQPMADLGLKSYFSIRSTSSWSQVAAGNDDTRWAQIANSIKDITPAGAWCFNHEPENDTLQYGSDANGALFTAAFDHVYSVIKPIAPNWLGSPCLFDEVFDSWEFGRGSNWQSVTDASLWIPSNMDLLGVDYYCYRGASDGGPHYADPSWTHVYDHATAVADFLSYATAAGVKLCFPEFSYVIKDPAVVATDVNNQIAWLSDFAATWAGNPDIEFLSWFEVNEDDGTKGNYAITDTTKPPMNASAVAALVSIGA